VERSTDALVIGAGLAGMKAALMLAAAGRRVHLVERTSMTGGRIIRCEDVFPSMECATCMISPLQQEILSHPLVTLTTLSDVISVEGSRGDFSVRVLQRASSVDPEACIGCAECWAVCPVAVRNPFEEDLTDRRAISVPCAGALPNVPWIDRDRCLRWTEGAGCTLCADACVFGAVDFGAADRTHDLRIGEILVATGFDAPRTVPAGLEDHPGVVSALRVERMFASNGPTGGEIRTLDGRVPSSVALLVHPPDGAPSRVSTMTALKLLHYFEKRLPAASIRILLDGRYRPEPVADPYHERWTTGGIPGVVRFQETPSFSAGPGSSIRIDLAPGSAGESFETDMLVPGAPMLPAEGTERLAGLLGIERGDDGRPLRPRPDDPTLSSRPGVFLAGAAAGSLDVTSSITMAAAAAGRILSWKGGE